MKIFSKIWSNLLLNTKHKNGIYQLNYLQQPYLLQVQKKQQILWPQQTGALYYRLLPTERFHLVEVQPRFFVQQYLQEFAKRVSAVIQNDDLSFAVITDTHIKFADSHSYYGFNGLQHLTEFLLLPTLLPLDFVAHLGDVIDGSDNAITDQQFLRLVSRTFTQQSCPYFIAKGNHDDNDKYDEHTATHKPSFAQNTFFNALWQPMYQQDTLLKVSARWGVGYFDKDDVRVIFINTTDVPFQLDQQGRKKYDSKLVLAIRNGQIQEIIQILEKSVNKKIIVCGHANLVTRKGQNALEYNGKAVHDLFKAFNCGLKGRLVHQAKDTNFSVNAAFDFRNNHSGRVVAYLCGHRHLEDQFKIDGIQYILLNVSALMGRNHALTTKYNYWWNRQKDQINEFSGYVVNLNRQNTLLRIFGYGAATPLRQFSI